jgi:hypothetical protein
MDIQDELRIIDKYKAFSWFGSPPEGPKYNTPISPTENLKRSVRREALWAPMAAEIEMFAPKIIPDNTARGVVIETERIDNDTQAGGPDFFGVEWEYITQVQGSMVRVGEGFPPKVPDITQWEKYIEFPDLASYDWEGTFALNRDFLIPERPTMIIMMNGMFERLISLMGFENAAIALIDDDQKPSVHRFFEKLCTFYDEYLDWYAKYYHFDVVCFHDDWGSQRSSFFSEELVREMIFPYLKHVFDKMHAQDIVTYFHSCGKIEPLVPVMIDAGADIWAGQMMNDQLGVLKEYGKDIMLETGPLQIFHTYTDEEIGPLTDIFLEDFGPYLDSVLVNNYFGTKIIYDKVYAYSRKSFAK